MTKHNRLAIPSFLTKVSYEDCQVNINEKSDVLMKLIQYAKSSQYGSLYRGTDGYPGIIFRSIYKPQI